MFDVPCCCQSQGTGSMEAVSSEDWTPQTLPSWHHSIYVGAVDPWMVISKPHAWCVVPSHAHTPIHPPTPCSLPSII